MHSFDEILAAYRRQVRLPWRPDAPPSARVWMLWHAPAMHLRITGRIGEFETVTRQAGHGWRSIDLGPHFGRWLAANEMFEPLLSHPQELRGLLPEYEAAVAQAIGAELEQAGDQDVLAVQGCGSLFGLAGISRVLDRVVGAINGRLLIVFPGRHSGGMYRLLDARNGWNYHAVPIPPDPL